MTSRVRWMMMTGAGMDEFLNVTVIGNDDEDETAAVEAMKVAESD